MAATGSGALLRRSLIGPRRPTGDVDLTPARPRTARVRIGDGFNDQGNLLYYASATTTPARCGPRKEEKRRMKLVKGLGKDLSAIFSTGLGVEKDQISEAADVLLAQLTRLRAEAKVMKKIRKQEKAAVRAAKMKDCGSESSSSSESSDSECETVVKMRCRSAVVAAPDPIAAVALQTETLEAIEEAKEGLGLKRETECSAGSCISAVTPVEATESKIEVCMGGKCKRSGAMELMAEFEKKVGIEGAVVGCKCMGKCRDGPNVRVANQRAEDGAMMKAARGALCIGVGLDDVGSIVADFFGENKEVGLFATA